MARIYAELIRKELKTIDEVPEKLRVAVQAILDDDNAGIDELTNMKNEEAQVRVLERDKEQKEE